MFTILFVCTGNTCRSPMAEAIARDVLAKKFEGAEGDVFVASAGVHATDGVRPTFEAIRALDSFGLEFAGRSKRLTLDMVRRADIVFCMTVGHQSLVNDLVSGTPEEARKVLLLDPDGDIDDPIGSDQKAYDALAQRFLKVIPKRLEEVLQHEGRAGS